jgi:hypothetical protein
VRESRAGRSGARLVVLGDLFELSGIERGEARFEDVSTRHALRRLELIFERHGEALAALGRVAAAGIPLDIVPGNHDFQLVRAVVRDRFVQLLTHAAGAGALADVSVHPGHLHLPGVLYAEHGQQRHPINRVPSFATGRPRSIPVGTQLGEFLSAVDRAGLSGSVRHALRFAAGLAPAGTALRNDARTQPEVESGGTLPRAAVERLDRMSAVGPVGMAAATLRNAAFGTREPYMLTAAREIDSVLAAYEAAVPLYLFGHTHVAADVRFRSGEARYLNPGSWSTFRPEGAHRDRLCAVEIERSDTGDARARLVEWDDAARVRRALPTS